MLKHGGTAIFTVVHPTLAGLQRAELAGQPTGEGYVDLTEKAGFRVAEVDDLTAAYQQVAGTWLRAAADLEPELRRALGDEVYEHRVEDRTSAYERASQGLAGRVQILAVKP